MANEKTVVYNKETGEPTEAFSVDAKEMVASGSYSYEEVVPGVPAELDRAAIKQELTDLGVEFYASAPTEKLVALLAEKKAE